MQIRPLRDQIVVKMHKPADVTPSGIYIGIQIDDGLVKEIVDATVVAVGPGLRLPNGRLDTMWDLAPGDKVRLSPVGSMEHKVEGEIFTLIRRDAIVGTYQEVAA